MTSAQPLRGSVLSYFQMCETEGTSLQRGMNFRPRGRHSIFLMSTRPGAPYPDKIEDEGTTLIYVGHDIARSADTPNTKLIDQPYTSASGSLTENGKFFDAAMRFKKGEQPPDLIRVYEKLRAGIWTDDGYFHLIDAWRERDDHRQVFKFRLQAVEAEDLNLKALDERTLPARTRLIPSSVKQAVWLRDLGKCVTCGATDELHFDHIVPYSKGGTSIVPDNVQLLCARHNLSKSAKIE